MRWCSLQINGDDLQAIMYSIICKYHGLNINNGKKVPVFPGYICNKWQNMIYHIIYHIISCHTIFKGLITGGRKLQQQHPSDLLSGTGTSRERSPIITWLNNFVSNVFTTKYVQNPLTSSGLHYDVTRLFLTTGVVASHIPSRRVRRVKLCGQVMQEKWFVAIKIVYMNSPLIINIHDIAFWKYKSQVLA